MRALWYFVYLTLHTEALGAVRFGRGKARTAEITARLRLCLSTAAKQKGSYVAAEITDSFRCHHMPVINSTCLVPGIVV